MAKTVYLREKGNDKNDGLTSETAVCTAKRAVQVSRKEKMQQFNISGSLDYHIRIRAELENECASNSIGPKRKAR
jgi:hypothetical protein